MKKSHRQNMQFERALLLPAIAVVFTTATSIVNADILYDRTDITDNETWNEMNASCITLRFGGWDRQTADDFELGDTYEITSLAGDFSNGSPAEIPADGFLVEFFPNETHFCSWANPPCAAEVPVAAVFSSAFTTTLLPVKTPNGNPIQRFEVDLTGAGIILGPGIWWVSLVAVDESGEPSSLENWQIIYQNGLAVGVSVHARAGGVDHGNGYQGGMQPDWRTIPHVNPGPGDAAIRIEGNLVGGCPADLDGSGAVNTSDLLELFAAWGKNPGNPADLDGDGTVNTTDLLILFANWGPCP